MTRPTVSLLTPGPAASELLGFPACRAVLHPPERMLGKSCSCTSPLVNLARSLLTAVLTNQRCGKTHPQREGIATGARIETAFLLSRASAEHSSQPRLPRETPSSVVLTGRGEDPVEYKWIWASARASRSTACTFPRTQPGLCLLSKLLGQLSLRQQRLLPIPWSSNTGARESWP